MLVSIGLVSPISLTAQVVAPDERQIFQEDADRFQEQLSNKRKSLMTPNLPGTGQVDFTAPIVQFDQEENIISGSGGVLISGQGFRLQGERGSVDLDTNDASLEERVVLSGETTRLTAEKLQFNLDAEVGEFEETSFTLEDSAFQFSAAKAEKLNDVEFEMEDCSLTTCACEDGNVPWRLRATRVNAEREGYAHTYNPVFEFQGVPLFYAPWLAFPVKQERSSGLLVPEFGYSNRDGFNTRLPFFFVVDESTDFSLTPFAQTETRYGTEIEYREAYSLRSSFEGKLFYSDESPRDGELRGTDITNIAEPEIDENRVGLYAKQMWSNSTSSSVPLSLVSDIHWVSDTLLLRELNASEIGLPSSRYATSRIALRGQFGDFVSSSLVGEWNEALVTTQETTFQRLPELSVTMAKSYRPFGYNPYGIKVLPKFEFRAVNFQREEGYDGIRYNASPSIRIPFRYKNYFNSTLEMAAHRTVYSLDDLSDPNGGADLDGSNDRDLFVLNYQVGTALERVFELPQDSFLKTLTSLGARNQGSALQRVKHTIEPSISFSYVPGTSQADLPLFDSFDRVRKRSLITYEVMTRLFGSFDSVGAGSRGIEELMPETDQFETLDTLSPLSGFDRGMTGSIGGVPGGAGLGRRRGGRNVRQLASARLVQSYDYTEDQEDLDPNRRPFSDLGAQFYLTPTADFGLGASTNYNPETGDVSSWSLESHFFDDRGDSFRARYTSVDGSVGQVEGNLELVLSPRVKLGYYARFDERTSEFLEQQSALRFSSACDCWHIDLGFTEELNPNREAVLLRFFLRGLGNLTQNFGFNRQGNSQLPES